MSSIKSQPVYQPLAFIPCATSHIFASAGEGLLCLQRMLAEKTLDHLSLSVLHVDSAGAENQYAPLLQGEVKGPMRICSTEDELIMDLEKQVEAATSGAALYLAGPEIFIWKAAAIAKLVGMSRDRIHAELRGSKARRVYCLHCKSMNVGVTRTVHVCQGCGHSLLVRDHYSRFLQAYAGVRIDAEEPGIIPSAEELYA